MSLRGEMRGPLARRVVRTSKSRKASIRLAECRALIDAHDAVMRHMVDTGTHVGGVAYQEVWIRRFKLSIQREGLEKVAMGMRRV
jgi:hypothetical protein